MRKSGSRLRVPPTRLVRVFVNSTTQVGVAQPYFAEADISLTQAPYRFIVKPIVEYAIQQQSARPDRNITVLIPELIESHWYHYLLHNNRPEAIRALLLLNGNQRITVTSIPYHIRA